MDRQDGQDEIGARKPLRAGSGTRNPTPRHILFVYSTLSQLGGIETLIVRLSRRLHSLGHRVTILLQQRSDASNEDPALLAEVSKYATVRFVRGWFRAAPGSLSGLDFGDVDFVYACESNSLLLATIIQRRCAPAARLVAGVYHPREYACSLKVKRYQMRLVESVFRSMPLQNRFFMNEGAQWEHSEALRKDCSASPLIPIAVDTERFASTNRRPNPYLIVSVGRITDFKTYNFTMLEAIRTLRSRGLPVVYHVYGDGELFPVLKQRVCDLGLEDCVILHGAIAYERFGAVMEEAGAFVGMGTALIEAAACGVPALVAVDSAQEPVTYGFLHEVKGYNFGEYTEGQRQYQLCDKIEELSSLSQEEYLQVCERSRLRAADFSIEGVTDRLLECLEASVPFTYDLPWWTSLCDEVDLWTWRLLRAVGIADPYQLRYLRALPSSSPNPLLLPHCGRRRGL
jgi:glycosyltransferase involved in cell wall biosynthesis